MVLQLLKDQDLDLLKDQELLKDLLQELLKDLPIEPPEGIIIIITIIVIIIILVDHPILDELDDLLLRQLLVPRQKLH
jgi:hypothetical protein